MQLEASDAPATVEYVPVEHGVHCVAEVASENVPAEHVSHVAWPSEPCAVPFAQGVHVDAAAAEYVPAEHGVHCVAEVAEVALENVPAAQSLHEESPPSSPNLP